MTNKTRDFDYTDSMASPEFSPPPPSRDFSNNELRKPWSAPHVGELDIRSQTGSAFIEGDTEGLYYQPAES
ncbi:MAG: hypothetical protein OXF20_12765 [Gammaproteobacteria bacterium]|nr:hypothetical protein [Gammaproteobacteria bacterium]